MGNVMGDCGRIIVVVMLAAGVLAGGRGEAKPVPPGVSVGVKGTEGQIFQPDPKRPGKFAWKIWAEGASVSAVGSGATGQLTGVTAVLFQKGVASALLSAPVAHYDSGGEVVTATGRVHVKSETEAGTTLDADTVTWYRKTDKIVATGNVIYRRGKTGLTMRVPRLNADTVLKSASFGTGSATLR